DGERADHHQLVLPRLADQEREELLGRRIGPLQVVDDQDQRRAARVGRAEEAVHVLHRLYDAVVEAVLLSGGRRGLLTVGGRDQRAQQTADLRGDVRVGIHRRHHLLEDLEERRVDALAVDRAASAEDARAVELRAQRRVAYDAALPHPLRARENRAAAATFARLGDQRRQLTDFVLAADERRRV